MMILNELKAEALKNNVPIVKDDTLKKILDTIKENGIKNILEIGSATGYSAINFSLISKDIKVYTIEKDRERYLRAKENIKNFNLTDQIKIIHADANEHIDDSFFDRYKEFIKTDKFDMIFIDAAKGQYMNFLNKSIEFLNNGAYIIADNVLFKGYVMGEYRAKKHRTIVNNLRKFIDFLNNEEKFETKLFNIDDGLLISKIKS